MTVEKMPSLVVIFSGKRKSGKDHTTDILKERLGSACHMMRLSGPLKQQYAKENGLDAKELLTASEYKETFRADMIAWGEAKRNADSGYFCKLVEEEAILSGSKVWIITDARRPTDIEYFLQHYKTLVVRVQAPLSVRERRGWTFNAGVDDAPSECALDDAGIKFDVIIDNDDSSSKDVNIYNASVDGLVQRILAAAE
eukprot:CFRG3207T1